MLTLFLSQKNVADVCTRLENGLIWHQHLSIEIDGSAPTPIAVELRKSDSADFARLITEWLSTDATRTVTIRRDAEVFNAVDLSISALVYLLKTADDVHMFDVRTSRVRVDESHSQAATPGQVDSKALATQPN
jgi:hypothetical protein